MTVGPAAAAAAAGLPVLLALARAPPASAVPARFSGVALGCRFGVEAAAAAFGVPAFATFDVLRDVPALVLRSLVGGLSCCG